MPGGMSRDAGGAQGLSRSLPRFLEPQRATGWIKDKMNGAVSEGPRPLLETMCSSQADWHIADFCDKFIWGQIKCCTYTASTQLSDSSFQVKDMDGRGKKISHMSGSKDVCPVLTRAISRGVRTRWEPPKDLSRWQTERMLEAGRQPGAAGRHRLAWVLMPYLPLTGAFMATQRLKKKKSTYQCRRCGFDPWMGKIPWKRKWQLPFQYSCLGNPMDRGAWWTTVLGVTESPTWLSD